MSLTLFAFLCGVVTLAGVVVLHANASRSWRDQLEVFRLLLPADLTADDVARWLGMVAAATSLPRWSGRPPTALGLHVRASARGGIEHILLVPEYAVVTVLQTIRAGLPNVRIEPVAHNADDSPNLTYGRELMLTTHRRQLAVDRAEAVATTFLSSLQPLAWDQELHVLWYFGGAGTPRLPTPRTRGNRLSASWLEAQLQASSEERRAQIVKDQAPQLNVSIRIGARAATVAQAKMLAARTAATLRGMNAPGVRITHRRLLPRQIVVSRMARHVLPLAGRMLLNVNELAGLIGLPISDTFIEGLTVGTSRQLPPRLTQPRGTSLVLARSTYAGTNRLLRIETDDRLRHMWLLGPTGTGKSTLIANMALQDAAAGRPLVLVDPKTDLVQELLARLPEDSHSDVIVLDPSAFTRDKPVVGLNILGQARTEQERELAADQVVHIMSSIWADSWGPRSADVIRNSILTLTHTQACDGSAHTLIELSELLSNSVYRRFVTTQPGVPESVRPFWAAYESYSEQQRLQIIGPALNKLRALSTRTSLRLMLGQSTGLDIGEALDRGKIILVPLSKGVVGVETAQLLGSLVVAQLTNTILARANRPAAQRRPTMIYLDEFQDVMRMSGDVADALAQFRALGAGFILANQYLHQLPESIRRACFGTVRSTVLFQLDLDDARVFERRFAPLTTADLTHLPKYEIAARLCEHNSVTRPVTAATLPLPEAESDGNDLMHDSAQRYGLPRSDIEAAVRARIAPPVRSVQASKATSFGRRKLDGGDR